MMNLFRRGLLRRFYLFFICLSGGWCLSACAPFLTQQSTVQRADVQWDDGKHATTRVIKPVASVPLRMRQRRPVPPVDPATLTDIDVWLYVSQASQAQLMTLGTDPTTSIRIWENYFGVNQISFARISGAADLNRITPSGVLLLASTVVLSEAEKQAVFQWRNRGGSVLSTWLTASHSAEGQPEGDAFMRDVLDVQVAGDTKDEEDDTYMIVHGDNPVLNDVTAGMRVWLERVPNQLPVRLVGKQDAAQIMSWSRTNEAKKPSGLIAFNERKMPSGRYSRTVTLGYPEQNWLRSDPKQLNAIHAGVLSWLWRRPDAYLGAWPYPYESGFLVAVQAAEPITDVDVPFAKAIRDMGGRATYYVLSENANRALSGINAVSALGHDIAYLSNTFEGFEGQSQAKQRERMDTMQKQLAEAKVKVSTPAGFSAPMDSYDETTKRLLVERQLASFLSFMEVSESALPLVASRSAQGLAQTVVLPRTLIGPEEAIELGDPAEELESYLKLLTLSVDMGGLVVMRLPTKTILSTAQIKQVIDTVAGFRARIWMASANQISQWWRSRERVSVSLQAHPRGQLLRATVAPGLEAPQPLTIWVNLPRPNTRVRLKAVNKGDTIPPVVTVDAWRSAVVLGAPAVGVYEWMLEFEDAPVTPSQ